MNYLLKIVQGVNAGAEIALAEGVVTFGSSDACDIILADASLPAEAFAIETSDSGVSMRALPDGEAKNVDLYTLFSFGNSTFAVGENGAAWPELKPPSADRSGETPLSPEEGPAAGETPPPPGEGSASAGRSGGTPLPPGGPAAGESQPSRKQTSSEPRRRGCGCLLVLLLVLLFFACGYFLALRYGRFWESAREEGEAPPSSEASPEKSGVPPLSEASSGGSGAPPLSKASPGGSGVPPLQEAKDDSLADWAAEHGLAVSKKDGETVLSGNFTNRAERLVCAQEAYERDQNLVLDLSDDETLKSGVEEVLFVLTEGRTRLEVATNRVVKLVGRARSREELLHTVAAICTDVNRVRVVDDTAVVCEDGLRTKAPTRYQALSRQAADKHPFATPAAKPGLPEPKCPVAGVILMPYPCLVLRDGSRAAEGSVVGEFKVEKIEANKVTLKRGEETVIWKP